MFSKQKLYQNKFIIMLKKLNIIFFIYYFFVVSPILNATESNLTIKIKTQQQEENPDAKIMLENLAKLKEIKELQDYISKTNNKSRGVSYIIDSEKQNVDGKDCYRIRTGINGKFRWEGHYIFYVNSKNLKEFFIEDVIEGDIVFMEIWRDRERKRIEKYKKELRFKIFDNDGYTNLRKEKNTTSSILEKVKTGEAIEILNNKGNWYLVKTKAGNQGYVYKTKIISE